MDNWGGILLGIIYFGLGFWGMGRERRRIYWFLGVVVFLMWLFGFWEN
jgi:hypothetical protein|tara:strand:- start:24 stop:167 length:144 start_codon:yes stop_codon:yes gene_type:complete